MHRTYNIVVFVIVLLYAAAHADTVILFEQTTPFNHLRVTEEDGHRDLYSGTQWQGSMTISQPTEGLPYRGDCAPWARRPLMLGLGTGQIAKAWLASDPPLTARFTIVEIDPAVEQVARCWFGLPVDPRVQVILSDGVRFLRESHETYDVLFVDAYDDDGIASATTTDTFYSDVRRAIGTDGVAFFNHIGQRVTEIRARWLAVCQTPQWVIASQSPVRLRELPRTLECTCR